MRERGLPWSSQQHVGSCSARYSFSTQGCYASYIAAGEETANPLSYYISLSTSCHIQVLFSQNTKCKFGLMFTQYTVYKE